MAERDAVFREKLIGLMSFLNSPEGRRPDFRTLIGGFAKQVIDKGRGKVWADVKAGADRMSYDSLLRSIQSQGATFQAQGDLDSVRALEALAISLVARHQAQPDLIPGVRFLDEIIETCAAEAKQALASDDTVRPTAH